MIDYGDGWDTERFSNVRLSLNRLAMPVCLTVFDSNLGQDRTANVSEQAGTLTSYGTATNRIYRVIGTSSLLGGAAVAAMGEGVDGRFHRSPVCIDCRCFLRQNGATRTPCLDA